jgi:ABC-2 type transport system permease protein
MTTAVVSAPVRAFLRLELVEALRSRWAQVAAAVDAVALGGFLWFGLRESSVLGFTGISRVALNVANVLVVAMPLVALLATTQSVPRARATGLFELTLTQPTRRSAWFDGLVAARAAVLLGPLVVMLAIATISAVALGEAASLPSIARSLGIALALVWAFVGIGLYVSSRARSAERALVWALVVWVVTSALHDFALIGVLLRVRLPPQLVFALAAINPAEAARVAILGASDPELSVLGPVGFWIANGLGPALLTVVGVGWPLALGTIGALAARRRFVRGDLVG